MPGSAEEGRDLMFSWIFDKMPASVLDIGVGCGTYGKVLRELDPKPWLIGVEAWLPYVDRFGLTEIYDELVVADVRELFTGRWRYRWPRVDVVILGDVLEHMTVNEARKVWAQACVMARKAVYLSIPIIHYPQGHEEGNPFEEHIVDDWSHERVIDTFPGITWHWQGTIVGRYEAVKA